MLTKCRLADHLRVRREHRDGQRQRGWYQRLEQEASQPVSISDRDPGRHLPFRGASGT